MWDDYNGDGCIMTHKFKMVLDEAKNPMHVYAPLRNFSCFSIVEFHQGFVENVYMSEIYPFHNELAREISHSNGKPPDLKDSIPKSSCLLNILNSR